MHLTGLFLTLTDLISMILCVCVCVCMQASIYTHTYTPFTVTFVHTLSALVLLFCRTMWVRAPSIRRPVLAALTVLMPSWCGGQKRSKYYPFPPCLVRPLTLPHLVAHPRSDYTMFKENSIKAFAHSPLLISLLTSYAPPLPPIT